MADNKYAINAKILDWWRDFDTNEYLAIIEINNEWRLISTKVEVTNGGF